jgi:hypothetical protein
MTVPAAGAARVRIPGLAPERELIMSTSVATG